MRKNGSRVPYDPNTCMVWNIYDEIPWKPSMWKLNPSLKRSPTGIWNATLQRWTQITDVWFAFSNQQPNYYSKWDETKQFQDPIVGIACFQTSWVQNIDHEST